MEVPAFLPLHCVSTLCKVVFFMDFRLPDERRHVVFDGLQPPRWWHVKKGKWSLSSSMTLGGGSHVDTTYNLSLPATGSITHVYSTI